MLKKILAFLVLGLVVSFCINRVYERYFRPENVFFSDCLQKTKEWEQVIRQKKTPCYVFAGGSEVRMGIDPEIVWEKCGLPVINAGVQAANGVRCNIQSALDYTKPGDTLVISIILRGNFDELIDMSHGGVNFCYRHQGVSMYQDGMIPFNYDTTFPLLVGDSFSYSIHLMRLLTRPDCIYRYSSAANARISNSGRVEVLLDNEQKITPLMIDLPKSVAPSFELNDHLINDIKKVCAKRSIRPVVYISRTHSREWLCWRSAHFALYLTKRGIKVLKDPNLGSWTDHSAYADTLAHFSIEGGQRFSVYIAELLKREEYWTEEELLSIIEELN